MQLMSQFSRGTTFPLDPSFKCVGEATLIGAEGDCALEPLNYGRS